MRKKISRRKSNKLSTVWEEKTKLRHNIRWEHEVKKRVGKEKAVIRKKM